MATNLSKNLNSLHYRGLIEEKPEKFGAHEEDRNQTLAQLNSSENYDSLMDALENAKAGPFLEKESKFSKDVPMVLVDIDQIR